MLEKKTPFSRTTIIWALVAVLGIAGVTTLVFAFNGNSPEEDVNAIYTNAALTVEAQQLTLLASQPTATVTPFVTLTPFVTNTVFATSTLPPLSAFATNTQAIASTGGCDNSVYVSDVTIPDNTVVTPGQALTKTWKVQNSGTCAWTATYKITFVTGNAMGGVATAIGQAVGPGQSVDISVAMVAPTATGDASGTWRLANDKSVAFGTPLTIVVKVGGSTGTGTPTKTVTPTATGVVAPTAPTNLIATKTCELQTDGSYLSVITWQDNSNNENGFNIYVDNALHGSVGPNFTTYSIPAATLTSGTVISLRVEAFNNIGSSMVEATITCP